MAIVNQRKRLEREDARLLFIAGFDYMTGTDKEQILDCTFIRKCSFMVKFKHTFSARVVFGVQFYSNRKNLWQRKDLAV
jgi:Mg2+ and Co2+ transporter CorA